MVAEMLDPEDGRLAQIARMHRRAVQEWVDGAPVHVCAECGQRWPCRTARIVEGGQ